MRTASPKWLPLFYLQLFACVALSVALLPAILSNLNPFGWDSMSEYCFYDFAVVPLFLAQGIEAIAATRLLKQRTEKNIKLLRETLLAVGFLSAVSLAIDVNHFPRIAIYPGITLVFAVAWREYFRRKAFTSNTWAAS